MHLQIRAASRALKVLEAGLAFEGLGRSVLCFMVSHHCDLLRTLMGGFVKYTDFNCDFASFGPFASFLARVLAALAPLPIVEYFV
ncbi:hypothetical protein Tdes44962_MAKER04356 [Teratosphaeria destructans]|uniref:Uncharacterized protein n=1 Tax=Teratosphaeria destructans TaxID=418781 RepID=A0A9W7VZZ9_9PEZI|nr:hypothetical protein Tdes44962_MAKER04356 [Teratosphaeria destructans]